MSEKCLISTTTLTYENTSDSWLVVRKGSDKNDGQSLTYMSHLSHIITLYITKTDNSFICQRVFLHVLLLLLLVVHGEVLRLAALAGADQRQPVPARPQRELTLDTEGPPVPGGGQSYLVIHNKTNPVTPRRIRNDGRLQCISATKIAMEKSLL